MTNGVVPMPPGVGVALAHAEVQAIAEDARVDLLHIKGPALDESLLRSWPKGRTGQRASIDTDVLVRPTHVARLTASLTAHGWRCLYDFRDGSAFEHAATWGLQGLVCVDLHRYFPGIEANPQEAFDILWAERAERRIAGVACWVPSLPAQRLIVLIHAARGHAVRDVADRQRAWYSIDEQSREEVDALAARVSAHVALRASTGRLQSVQGEPTYRLWRHLTSDSTSPLSLWWARVSAAPTRRDRMRVGARLLLPNPRRIATALGRPPTRREMLTAYRSQIGRGAHAISRSVRFGSKDRQ